LCAAYDACNEDDGNECTDHRCSRYSGECEHVPVGRPCAYSCGPCPFPTLCSGPYSCGPTGVCRAGVCVEDE
jgi:hypothetical protein